MPELTKQMKQSLQMSHDCEKLEEAGKEIEALKAVIVALIELNSEQRRRIIEYVIERYGIDIQH